MGDGVTLVSSADETAKDVYRTLVAEGLERPDRPARAGAPVPHHRRSPPVPRPEPALPRAGGRRRGEGGLTRAAHGGRLLRLVPRARTARRPATSSRRTGSGCCSTSAAARSAACSGTSTSPTSTRSLSATCTPTTASTSCRCYVARTYDPRRPLRPAARRGPRSAVPSTWRVPTGGPSGRVWPRRSTSTSGRRAPRRFGPLTVTVARMAHPVETYGMRVEHDGGRAGLLRRHRAVATRSSSSPGAPTSRCSRPPSRPGATTTRRPTCTSPAARPRRPPPLPASADWSSPTCRRGTTRRWRGATRRRRFDGPVEVARGRFDVRPVRRCRPAPLGSWA